MLTKLFRYGPGRMRILRGFTVAAAETAVGSPADTVKQLGLERPSLTGEGEGGLSVVTDLAQPRAIWIDTGWCWMHTPKARDEVFGQLGSATRRLVELVERAGCTLLPNAVKLNHTDPWGPYLVGDRYFLETYSLLEQTVLANLLRDYSAELIAISARAGVTPEGVGESASQRLTDSSRHYAARRFASTGSQYLRVLEQELRREQDVSRLAELDVVPDAQHHSVEIRFADGQLFLSSVRVQAVLYQALLSRARRLAHLHQDVRPLEGLRIEGDETGRLVESQLAGMSDDGLADEEMPDKAEFLQRIHPVDQPRLEQNRSLAVAQGLGASLQVDYSSIDSHDGEVKPAVNERRRKTETTLASDSVYLLLTALRDELLTLSTEYREIAPLVLGLELERGLRSGALQGKIRKFAPSGRFEGERDQSFSNKPLRNENDWFRREFRAPDVKSSVLHHDVTSLLQSDSTKSDIVIVNERSLGEHASELAEGWIARLTPPWTPVDGLDPDTDELANVEPSDQPSSGADDE